MSILLTAITSFLSLDDFLREWMTSGQNYLWYHKGPQVVCCLIRRVVTIKPQVRHLDQNEKLKNISLATSCRFLVKTLKVNKIVVKTVSKICCSKQTLRCRFRSSCLNLILSEGLYLANYVCHICITMGLNSGLIRGTLPQRGSAI